MRLFLLFSLVVQTDTTLNLRVEILADNLTIALLESDLHRVSHFTAVEHFMGGKLTLINVSDFAKRDKDKWSVRGALPGYFI